MAVCRTIPLDDLPPERIWGEFEKLLLLPARPSLGFEFARDAGLVSSLLPEMAALIGCEQEPDWHPEGDVWVHTLMVIDQARARIDDLPRWAQSRRDAGRRLPRFRQAGDHRVLRRPHPLVQPRGGRGRAGPRPARSAERPRHRRRGRARAGVRPDGASSQAGRVAQGARPGGRRRLSAAGAEGGPGAARTAGGRRLRRPRGDRSTARR